MLHPHGMKIATFPGGRRRGNTSFGDVLTEITAAAGVLLDKFRCSGALQAARLTCKALRAFIDENADELRLKVSEDDLHQWGSSPTQSLARWPRASAVALSVDLSDFLDLENLSLCNIAALPFACLDHALRARIRRVRLELKLPQQPAGSNRRFPEISSELIVRSLVVMLPQLRSLDLWAVRGMSYQPLDQHLLYDSLAALPHLEELVLPSHRALDRIGTLADGPARLSLRRLSVLPRCDFFWRERPTLYRNILSGIERLSRLQELRLTGFQVCDTADPHQYGTNFAPVMRRAYSDVEGSANLVELLESLPTSVKQLRLTESGFLNSDDHILFGFHGGQLRSVALQGGEKVAVRQLATLAYALLGSRVMQRPGRDNPQGLARPPAPPMQQQEQSDQQQQQQPHHPHEHQLESFYVESVYLVDFDDLPHEIELPPLMQLLARCKKVGAGRIRAFTDDQVVTLGRMFGKPRCLALAWGGACSVEVQLRGEHDPPDWAPSQQQQQQRLESVPEGAAQQPPSQPLTCAAVGEAAAALARSTDVPQPALLPSAEDLAARVCERLLRRSPDPAPSDTPEQGPGYSSGVLMLRGQPIRDMSAEQIANWAEEARVKSAEGGNAAAGDASLESVLFLPQTQNSVLLDWDAEEAAEAMAAVLREAGAGELEVLTVEAVGLDTAGMFSTVFSQVLQEVWDGRWASGAAAALGEEEMLRQLAEAFEKATIGVYGGIWLYGDLVCFEE